MKQDIYANRALDFNVLNPRDFEEIVYHYFKDQIAKGLYKALYDNVELSSGVGEQGADAMLFFQGKIRGVIQCKKLKNNIGIQVVLTEIVKLLLYHILEIQSKNSNSSSLIDDIEDFTYYLVVSKDFTQNTKKFLADFNSGWKEKQIKPIFNKLTKQKTFSELDKKRAFEKLKPLLNLISVATLNAVDLDPIIRLNTAVLNRFFSPVPLTPIDSSQDSTQVNKSSSFDLEEATKKIETISQDITRVKSHFGSINDSIVERREVQEIFNWIQKRPAENESNIAVVAGNAGIGKTVIMSRLYEKLSEQNIPVVSFKADRMVFSSFNALKEEYSLNEDLEKLFENFIGARERGVLLIDQIDALSQTLSSDLKPLRFYDSLIQRFKGHPKVKIVISTRIYDLNYDPIIANYKGTKTFKIGLLEKASVLSVLDKYNINQRKRFTDSFLKLLAVPLHLEVFLSIYDEELNVDEINSLQDLYSELWRQKILDYNFGSSLKTNGKKVSKFIFKVAGKMYKRQDISLDSRLFEDKYNNEIKYLKSAGILGEGKKIEFFHQSFFDYAYARYFLKSNKDLTKTLLERHQGLFIRSKVKQVLNYKRNVAEGEYVKDVKNILQHQNIRFHIKLLIMQQMAFQEHPLIEEQDIAEQIIFKDKNLRCAFTSLIMGAGWQYFFIDRNIFTKAIEEDNVSYKNQILRSFRPLAIQDDQSCILQYYNKLKDTTIKDELILDYFWQIQDVKEKMAIEMIEEVFRRKNDYRKEYWFYRVLEHSVKHFPDWVANTLCEHIDIKEGSDVTDDRNYFYPVNQGSQVYEKLWKEHPDVAYGLVKRIIKEIIRKRRYDRDGNIIVDSAYLLYDRKNINLYKHYEQLDRLQQHLENSFVNSPEFTKTEVRHFLESKYITEIIISFTVMHKYPEAFVKEAFGFFINIERMEEVYSFSQYLKYLILDVFGDIYHRLSSTQQKKIDDATISKFQTRSELSVRTKTNFPGKNWFGIGKYELLTAIKHKGVLPKHWNKNYRELLRKFGETENKEPEGITIHVNRDPIQGNYGKFSFLDWTKSFKKYTRKNKNYDSWNYPEEFEHGRKFSGVVAQDPGKFIPYIQQIIDNKAVSNTYVMKGLEGLKDGKVSPKNLKDLLIHALEKRDFEDERKLYLIWLTRYFAEKRRVYPEVLAFLKQSIENGDEGRDLGDDALSRGINSVRGAAAGALIDYSFTKDTFDFICKTLEDLAGNSKSSTRAAAINKLQYLLEHDRERVLNLFLKLSDDYAPGILKVCIAPLQYLVHYEFEKLVPFFREALKVQEANYEIGKLITIGFCNEYSGTDELMEAFIKVNEPNSLIQTAFEFIEHSHKIERALEIINRFLDLESKEVGEIYNRAFFHIKPESFNEIRDFLFVYIESKVGQRRDHPFYDFLLKCSGNHSEDCIKLASKYENHIGINVTQRTLRNEPLKVIINAYNAVRDYRKDSPMADKAMDIFDSILKNDEYRDSSAYRILHDVDAY